MKLVDILARELAEWPVKEGVYPPGQDYCIQSDKCSQVFFCGTHGKILLSRRADKTSGVRVTRAEWQAAVDALNAPKVVEWDGAGLPPAGSTFQIRHSGWAAGSWETVDIKYISSEYLIIGHGNFKREQHFHMPDIQFRPIRTAEQVADEEREKAAIKLFYAVMDHPASSWDQLQNVRKDHYLNLVDAGWQQVAK